MLNQIILVGRLVQTPELFLTENGKKGSFVTLAVNRSFKNQNGEYDTDYIDCTLWTGIAENTAEYCKSGDVIGVRGRIQSRLIDNDDGTKYKKMEIIAEKVTFLSSNRNNRDITLENNDNDSADSTSDDTGANEEKKNKKKK